MSKIHIKNISSHLDTKVLPCVIEVMRMGRISKTAGQEHYCAVTTFHSPEVVVIAGITKTGADTFIVQDDVRRNEYE